MLIGAEGGVEALGECRGDGGLMTLCGGPDAELVEKIALTSMDQDIVFVLHSEEHHGTVAGEPFVGDYEPVAVGEFEFLVAMEESIAETHQGKGETVVEMQYDMQLKPVAAAHLAVCYVHVADIVLMTCELLQADSHLLECGAVVAGPCQGLLEGDTRRDVELVAELF